MGLLVGVFSSAGVGVVIALLGGNSFGSGAVTYMFMVAVLLVPFASGLAYLAGSQRAFALKLQAQTALCQVQIELNTRPQR